ncbi:hypothetical protein C1J03_18140 [Sulfitobacter sp. SK012]|uniref:hypothetical protein n=1 Tax=Sulfitobacter sp. SK012 TaxID=1389005 RepID=UPI000E0B0F61|nr:hypothetical protein [Sulfitobacter sp. SK012]AXI47756.1 hypothetical protein C1J03_18140 [Sulfitobacter sp. SK012]
MTLALATTVALSGCAEFQTAVDSTARRGAKGVVAETLAIQFPAVPKEMISPFTDCIIDNASSSEIGEFTKDTVVGTDEKTAALIRDILSRPETVECLRSASTNGLAG